MELLIPSVFVHTDGESVTLVTAFAFFSQVAIKIIPKARVFGWAKVSDNLKHWQSVAYKTSFGLLVHTTVFTNSGHDSLPIYLFPLTTLCTLFCVCLSIFHSESEFAVLC